MKLIRTLSISAAALLLAACGGGHNVATSGANTPTATSAVATTTLASTNTSRGVATTVAPPQRPVIRLDRRFDAQLQLLPSHGFSLPSVTIRDGS